MAATRKSKPKSNQKPARKAAAGANRRGDARPAVKGERGAKEQRGAQSRSATQAAPRARGNDRHGDARRDDARPDVRPDVQPDVQTDVQPNAPPNAPPGDAQPRDARQPAARRDAARRARPAQPPRSDALREDLDPEATPPGSADAPNLMFSTPRAPLDSDPDQRHAPAPGAAGNATLTSHLNDPAMRRRPAAPADGAPPVSRSDISPLARDAATPADEHARLQQEAAAADARARHGGMAPRGDVEKWHQAEENRQSDLPGSPRKDLPG